MRHNGYSNYVTWAVSLWIWNDDALYRYWVTRAAQENLAEELETWAYKSLPELKSFYAELMDYALGTVCWNEIAEGLAEMT